MISLCKSLGVKDCYQCTNNNIDNCWIRVDMDELSKTTTKEAAMKYMLMAFALDIRRPSTKDRWVFYLSRTVDAYFPQYKKMLDTLILLQ